LAAVIAAGAINLLNYLLVIIQGSSQASIFSAF
jgi:hypothetical protein